MESIKFKKYSTYAAIFLLLSAMIFSVAAFKANAAGSAAISYTTSKPTVNVGDSFDINVNITDVSSLYGASIDFKYDPSLFRITGISKGSIFGTVNSGTPVNDTSSGLISFYCTLQGKVSGLSSTGTKSLFIIHAKALKGGSVNLQTIATNDILSNTGNNVRIKLVDSTDINNPIKYTAVNKTLNVSGAPVSISSVTVDKASPQPASTKIKITASATGGSSKLYKFSVLEGTTWKALRDYSSTNYYYWTPTKAAKYTIKVEVKDSSTGKIVSKSIYYTISSSLTISSIKTNLTSPQLVKAKVNISAYASGGSSRLYKFRIHDGIAWRTVRDYSTYSTYSWTPTRAAKHRIMVYVKDKATGKVVSKETSYYINSAVSISSLKTDKASPQKKNTRIKLTASASGSANLLYKFSVYYAGSWRTIRNYSSTKYYYWTPTKATAYTVRVTVKDSTTGKTSYKQINYKIN